MTGPIDPCVLWLRALCVGSVAFVLGTTGHVTADGLLPGTTTMAVLLALVVLLNLPLLLGPASPVRIVAMLVGGQAFIHLSLTVSAGHAGEPATPAAGAPRGAAPGSWMTLPDAGERTGSLLDAYHASLPQATETAAPALPVSHLVADAAAHAPMMAAHTLAAALVGLWLSRGEQALWALIALAGRLVAVPTRALRPVPAPPAPGPARVDTREPGGALHLRLLGPEPHRGPPPALA